MEKRGMGRGRLNEVFSTEIRLYFGAYHDLRKIA
jgi:hypothetical protein